MKSTDPEEPLLFTGLFRGLYMVNILKVTLFPRLHPDDGYADST